MSHKHQALHCGIQPTSGYLRLIAAEGTGFDPDWEKKTQY